MFKKPLSERQMSSAAYVDEARAAASELVRIKSRGPGDTENAMRRLEAEYGLPFWFIWRLRYKPPKDILVSLYVRLIEAKDAERDRQMRRLEHEREIARQKTGALTRLLGAADRLVGEQDDTEQHRRE